MGFNLKDYEEVKDRLPRFLSDTNRKVPRVITKLVTNPDNLAAEAAFVAELWDGETLLGTGYAFELRTDRGVNSTSHVENAETSAIGRALANTGYASGKNRPSREEMEKVERMSEPDRSGRGYLDNDVKPATDKQLKMIHVTAKKVGISDEVLHAGVKRDYGHDSTADLSKAQASELIEKLKKLEEKPMAEKVAEATGGTVAG